MDSFALRSSLRWSTKARCVPFVCIGGPKVHRYIGCSGTGRFFYIRYLAYLTYMTKSMAEGMADFPTFGILSWCTPTPSFPIAPQLNSSTAQQLNS